MQIEKTIINGLLIITPKVFEDERGFFMETYSKKKFLANGLDYDFIQDNHAKSIKGVLRGLHYQREPMAQTKLVYVIRGSVFDVALDIRRKSATFGQWFGMELNAKNKKMLLVPKGFAHGYCTLEDDTEFLYKVDNFYAPELEEGIIWNDPNLRISWPIQAPLVSNKDKMLPELKNVQSPF